MSGDYVFVAGDNQLGMLKKADNFSELHTIASVSHTKEISLVTMVSPTCLVTAGLDKMVKVWTISTEGGVKATLAAQFKTDSELL